MRTVLTLAVASLVLAGCGDIGTTSVPGLNQSAPVLSSPPKACGGGIFDSVRYSFDETAAEVSLGAPATSNLSVPGVQVLYADTTVRSGTTYLLVGAIDASDSYSLYRYHDAGSDGIPDDSTETLLFDSGTTKIYGTSGDILDDGTFFLLDARCQDVVVAEDTDSDLWPDALAMSAFALSATYPGILESRAIEAFVSPEDGGDEDYLVNLYSSSKPAVGSVGFPQLGLLDEDMDLIADSIVELGLYWARSIRTTDGIPVDGDTTVLIGGRGFNHGDDVEVKELNGSGVVIGTLGTGTMDEEDGALVTLSRALIEGETIRLIYTAYPTFFHDIEVTDDLPQVFTSQDLFVEEGVAKTLIVKGRSFVIGMTVELIDHQANSTALTYTLADSNTIEVQIPAQTLPTAPATVGIFGAIIRVGSSTPEHHQYSRAPFLILNTD